MANQAPNSHADWLQSLADDTDRLPAPTPTRLDRLADRRPLRDARGRFLGRSRAPSDDYVTIAAFEHAMIDTDAALYLEEVHHRLGMARTLLAALAFNAEADRLDDALTIKGGMLIRLGHQGDGS